MLDNPQSGAMASPEQGGAAWPVQMHSVLAGAAFLPRRDVELIEDGGGFRFASQSSMYAKSRPPSPSLDVICAQAWRDLPNQQPVHSLNRRFLDLAIEGFITLRLRSGTLLSGPDLLLELDPDDPSPDVLRLQKTAPLSFQGVLQAIALKDLQEAQLMDALYRFGATALQAHSVLPRALPKPQKGYAMKEVGRWTYFKRVSNPATGVFAVKLYVSPSTCDVPAVLEEIHRCGAQLDVATYKCRTDRTSQNLPDKIVVYFENTSQRETFVQLLDPSLCRYCQHGVPFAEPVGQSGLLFTAEDPSPLVDFTSHQRRSWRGYMCARLARYVKSAPKNVCAKETLDYVLRRAGVDELPLRGRVKDT